MEKEEKIIKTRIFYSKVNYNEVYYNGRQRVPYIIVGAPTSLGYFTITILSFSFSFFSSYRVRTHSLGFYTNVFPKSIISDIF